MQLARSVQSTRLLSLTARQSDRLEETHEIPTDNAPASLEREQHLPSTTDVYVGVSRNSDIHICLDAYVHIDMYHCLVSFYLARLGTRISEYGT